MEAYIKNNMIFYCENCGNGIYKANRDILGNEKISTEPIEGIPPIQNPTPETEMFCPYCMSKYEINNKDNWR